MATATPVLQAQGLTFGWPKQPLFRGMELAIGPGVTLVTGNDGCGKTTLLRLFAGDLLPESGTVSINGPPLAASPDARCQQVFWVHPQSEAHDNVSAHVFLQSIRQRYPAFHTEALADLVDAFALTPHLDKPMYMLSTGSKRKVWLSAAFASGAPVTLIDQPFAALDAPSIRCLRELLQQAAKHPSRAWVIADFEEPDGVPLAGVIRL